MTSRPYRLHAAATLALALGLSCSALAQQVAKPASPKPSPPANAGADSAGSPDQLFAQWDTDKSGQLSRKEFSEGWEQAREASLLNRLEAQFKSMDVDHSGVLEANEYANLPMIKRAGAGAPPLSAFDADRSGKIDFREYLNLIQAMIKRSTEGAR